MIGAKAVANVEKNDSEPRKPNSIARWGRLLLASKTGTVGLIIVVLVTLVAIFADVLTPHNPAQNNLQDMLKPPFWEEGGSTTYILGTDNLGRDILSRIIIGTRVSL